MIRDKMFVISELLDESIKSQTPVYDISLFRSFIDFENFIEGIPVIINTLVITTNELPFNNSNMARLMQSVNSPFLQITGSIIYIIDDSYQKKVVESFMKQNEVQKYAVYQGTIDVRFVTDIITGEARESQEQQAYEVTYRIRAKDFIKQADALKYDDLDTHYVSDEEDLQDIPDEEIPDDIRPSEDYDTEITYISGSDREERTVLAFLIAQYKSLSGKTVIIEHDKEFHRLTEYYTKSGIEDALFITMNEVYQNVHEVIVKIIETSSKLIVIGAIDRINYDYSFIFSLFYSNLRTYVTDFIMECDYKEVPYGVHVIYVTANTVPQVLETAVNIRQVVDTDKTVFIGLQMHDIAPIDLATQEMTSIFAAVLNLEDVIGEVLYAGSIKLKGEQSAYDIFSIISRVSRR